MEHTFYHLNGGEYRSGIRFPRSDTPKTLPWQGNELLW